MSRQKVHVRIGRNADGGHCIEVDGVDVSFKVLKDGFRVEFADEPHLPDLVHMVVAADSLDIDLPAAVIEAMRTESRV